MKFKLSLFICLLIHYLLSHIKKFRPIRNTSEPNLHKAKTRRVLSLTENDHLGLADLGVEPGRVL